MLNSIAPGISERLTRSVASQQLVGFWHKADGAIQPNLRSVSERSGRFPLMDTTRLTDIGPPPQQDRPEDPPVRLPKC